MTDQTMTDEFRGDDAHLVRCIQALLTLDAHNALVPHCIGGQARTLLTSAAVRLTRSYWTSVSERLPDVAGEYLVYRPYAHHKPAGDPNICIREFSQTGGWSGIHLVTYWMPKPAMPEPPVPQSMSAIEESEQ